MDTYLIVGLGNPGKSYANHRHNIGFQIVELLARRHGLSFDRKQQQSDMAAGSIGGVKVLLAKPQTFMNDSGKAVRALMQFYKIQPTHLFVIADDLDLEFAKMRLRPEGSSGGQNGIKSIIQHLRTQVFVRLKVGIGRPPGRMDPAAYVLQDFSAEQEVEMSLLRQEAADGVEVWLKEGTVAAMNKINGKPKAEGGKSKGKSTPPATESNKDASKAETKPKGDDGGH
jgi:PTH1 family peptidyl-tRNA hydrolase